MTTLFRQVEAVREAGMRANTALTDAQIIWSAGDWRVEQLRQRVADLEAAFNTLKRLHDKQSREREQTAHCGS